MVNLLIVGQNSNKLKELQSNFVQNGFSCSTIPVDQDIIKQVTYQSSDMVLVEMDNQLHFSKIWELLQRRNGKKLPLIIALISREVLNDNEINLNTIDDFIIEPYEFKELYLRVKRVLHKIEQMNKYELIRCGDLLINLNKCEVSLSGRVIMLTFKEYELLKFLMSNKEQVFTREMLLNKVWGYDYYGGDRTVDVHVRRLRSKIEDPKHTFIDTVRNIGYRFRENNQLRLTQMLPVCNNLETIER